MITSTKRKLIAREMSSHTGVVTMQQAMAIANRHHLTVLDVRSHLAGMGYQVETTPPPTPSIPKPPPAPKVTVAPEIIAAIMRGSIYKVIGNPEGEDPSTVFVVTTLDKWQRERDAIHMLLKG